MRTVLDGRLILNQMTGISRYLLGLLSGFSELEETPDLIVYLQPSLRKDHPVRQLTTSQLRLVDVPIRHMSLRQHVAIRPYLLKDKPDLYHYPHFDMPWWTSVPTVITIYDLIYLLRSDFFLNNSKLKQIYMRFIIRHAASQAKGIIAISKYTQQDLKKLMPVCAADPFVVHLAVDERYKPIPSTQIQAVRNKYNLLTNFILFVGERRPHKNITGLIKAFHRLNRRDLKIVIVGKSYTDYQEPEKLILQLNLSDQICFLPNVGDDDLVALYNGAKLFVFPSFVEGFGLPILEAMACGTPVITSNRTASAEVAGDSALLINPDDVNNIAEAIHHLLEDKHLYQNLIEKGFAQAAKFTWRETALKTLAVYQQALEVS